MPDPKRSFPPHSGKDNFLPSRGSGEILPRKIFNINGIEFDSAAISKKKGLYYLLTI